MAGHAGRAAAVAVFFTLGRRRGLSDNGENVLNALRVIEALGSELEALKDELEAMLLHAGAEAGVTFEGEDNAPDDNAYNDASGWVLTGWRWTYPAKERRTGAGRRRAVGGLTIVADIGRSGGLAEALGFPCLLVAWSNRLDDWEYVFDEGGGTRDKQRAEAFWPRNDQEEWLRADRLFWWLRSLGEGEGPDVAEKSRARCQSRPRGSTRCRSPPYRARRCSVRWFWIRCSSSCGAGL